MRPNQETQMFKVVSKRGEASPPLQGEQERKLAHLFTVSRKGKPDHCFRVVERDRYKVEGGLKVEDSKEA